MTTSASMPWSSTSSTASISAACEFSRSVASSGMYPFLRAASWIAASVLVGPKRNEPTAITPISPERRVTSVRAALLRR